MTALDTSALVTMTVGLFAITAPIAVLPLFVAATAGQTQGDQRRTALMAAATYVVAGLLALFVGNAALGVFGVSIAALRVAGMAVIGVIGWQMLNAPTPSEATPVRSHHHRASNTQVPVAAHNAVAPSPASVGILPLGFPIYAGPGVLSVIIAWGSGSRPVYLAAMVAILANAAVIVALDFLAAPITRVIGEKALLITEKIFGLLVVAIAVGGMASALVVLFPGLGGR
ncbi:MarC family protein [Sphingomonas sp. 10B4]|uniref:MarC family protein n=1 Tax=Sphingomonas sp. 10B4 TaxID=3048575 RepID=UPI002AB4D656|nr:MarC family protein [Sphingomonas sp. 10B4]MDY7523854.1 MarC family protein [Sphingomonas sp. 10B4]MEB0283101.1 MarC family protein [Sphingomonas sp. 10B4]